MSKTPTKMEPTETKPKSDKENRTDTTSDQHREALLDEALRKSFPASDPPSSGRTT